MKKELFIFLACFSIILVGVSHIPSSYGLTCAGPDLEDEFSKSNWVFLGKFISETDAGLFSDNTLMTFKVVENFKGATSPTLQVLNNPNWRHHFSDDIALIFAGPDLFGNPELFLCTNSGDFSEESISIVRELSRDDPKIQFEKCVIGKYEKNFGLGEWKIITRDKKNDSCIMNIYWQAEADSIEYYCKIPLSELKNSDWKISSFPLLDMGKSCSIIKKNSLLMPDIDYVLAPKKQLSLGIAQNEIICAKDLDLVFKSTGNYPACVQPESVPKLIERGWGFIRHDLSMIVFYTEKTEYEIGEPITIIMKNEGQKTFTTPSVPIGFSIFDKNEELICTWIGNYEGIGSFPAQANVTQTWNQHYCQDIMNNQQVSAGNYLIVADHFESYSKFLPSMKIAIVE